MRIDEWQQQTSQELSEVDPESTIALLPVGAVEQHGPHLPLGTDALIGLGIIEALAGEGDVPRVLVLPPLAVGYSLEHQGLPGTLSIEAEALIAVWTDIGRSVAGWAVQ